jgi:hypothetical protein
MPVEGDAGRGLLSDRPDRPDRPNRLIGPEIPEANWEES